MNSKFYNKKLNIILKSNLNQTRPMDLYRLMLFSALGSIKNSFLKNEEFQLPDSIEDYKLYKNLKKTGSRQSFFFGVYQNPEGQKAFAKIWYGKAKDFDYYTLKNEIRMYQLLNSVIYRVGKAMPKKFKDVYLPRFIKTIESGNSLILLIEFVDGETANFLTAEKKIQVYFQTVEFIRFLGTCLNPQEKAAISKRTPINYIVLYPFLLLKAIFTHPRAAIYLLKGVSKFLRCIPVLWKNSHPALVHRDLHFRNIIVSRDRVILIDLQFCVFTEMLHELITTLRYRWNEDEFYQLFIAEIKRRYSTRKDFEILFRGLSVNSLTHGLSDKRFPKTKITNWIDYLKFVSRPTLTIQEN